MKIKKGTVVYLSKFGYSNFIYPNLNKSIILDSDTDVLKRITWWIHDKNYNPFLVFYQNKKMTVWVIAEDSNV